MKCKNEHKHKNCGSYHKPNIWHNSFCIPFSPSLVMIPFGIDWGSAIEIFE